MHLRKKNFIIILFLCSIVSTNAKDDSIDVRGWVVDNIMRECIENAHITLMSVDSIVIDTTSTASGTLKGFYSLRVHKLGKYIVKASAEGYDDGYAEFSVRTHRLEKVFLPEIRLVKSIWELPEVTIKATKIKMVMRGDTIIYNADAFNLAEGSMLDALVSRLPGVELTKDGQIFVNGKYIQSLLLNGKDFFAGNPKIALENLPAYTVKNIQVYNKAGMLSQSTQKDMDDKILVMDVRLKKEYAVGYMGNITAGLGSQNRYLSKLFGMKYSDVNRIITFANINNLNDNQQIGYDGNWKNRELSEGLQATKIAGISYLRTLGTSNSKFVSDNILTHNNIDYQSSTKSQTFLPQNDFYTKSTNSSFSKSTSFSSNNSLDLLLNDFYITEDLKFNYTKKRNQGTTNSIMSDSTSMLNKQLMMNSKNNSDIYLYSSSHLGVNPIAADALDLYFRFYYRNNTSDDFWLKDILFEKDASLRDFRNNYFDKFNKTVNLEGNLSYKYQNRNRYIKPRYEYSFRYNKTNSDLYRLDWILGGDSLFHDILPSTKENLANIIDGGNSYHYQEYQNSHMVEIAFGGKEKWLGRNGRWFFNLPFLFDSKKLYYFRGNQQEVFKKHISLAAYFFISYAQQQMNIDLEAKMSSRIPDLTMMVNYQDDSDPLNIQTGNPELKNIYYYDTKLSLNRQSKRQQTFSFNLNYHRTKNAVAYELFFDKTTGISTVRPVSVNGNWSTSASLGYSRSLDKDDKWIIDNHFSYNYHHSVDMATVSGFASTVRSIVNNHQFSDNLKLTFRPNDNYEFTLHGGGTYYLVSSRREGFENINAGDYQVGFNTTLNLPAKFQFTTDLTMYARRGYQQSEMNTTDWVWNAQLTRSFLNGKLLAKLKGYDILQQLSNTRYVMNEQGRTESWHNGIPRYVMLSLSWRFNVTPKKKNE